MPKKLTNLFVRQIALVDAGANQDSHIVLSKRATPKIAVAHVGETITVSHDQVLRFVLKEPTHG